MNGLYILGYKLREEPNYHLTSWMGNLPMYYGVYDHLPSCWDENEEAVQIKPTEKELKDVKGLYIAFGWYKKK